MSQGCQMLIIDGVDLSKKRGVKESSEGWKEEGKMGETGGSLARDRVSH